MFIREEETDKYGITQSKFTLTQGDSCSIISTPKDEDGNIISTTLISSCTFKLIDKETHRIIFSKALIIYETTKYMFNLLATESALIGVGNYLYEIEYEFIDGGVNTPNQWKFNIIPQGIGD